MKSSDLDPVFERSRIQIRIQIFLSVYFFKKKSGSISGFSPGWIRIHGALKVGSWPDCHRLDQKPVECFFVVSKYHLWIGPIRSDRLNRTDRNPTKSDWTNPNPITGPGSTSLDFRSGSATLDFRSIGCILCAQLIYHTHLHKHQYILIPQISLPGS